MAKSTDGGANWFPIGPRDTFEPCLGIAPSDSQIIYAGTSEGVFKSTDAGQSWSLLRFLTLSRWSATVFIHPAHPSIVYAGTHRPGVFKTGDGGNLWSQTNSGLDVLNLTR